MGNDQMPTHHIKHDKENFRGIFEVPSNRRYWLVRSDGGRYFDHFIKHNAIALSHLNRLNVGSCAFGQFKPCIDDLRKSYMELVDQKDKRAKTQAYTQLNQAIRFLYEMEVGDWVITVGSVGIRYGVITSDSYIERDPLVVEYDEGEREISMDKHLRRNVDWGPIIRRGNLPYGLSQALRARQTVTSLDAHWQALHHSIFPAFIANDNLYLSIKIATNNDIENYSIMSVFKLLNEIEVIGKEFDHDFNKDNFEQVFDTYLKQGLLSVTTKAQFHSPGDIWAMIKGTSGDKKWLLNTFIMYSMLFGNNSMGIDGIVDVETRRKMWDIFIERVQENKAEGQLDKLDMRMPKVNTVILEVPVERKSDPIDSNQNV